jgi:hypothetical protein
MKLHNKEELTKQKVQPNRINDLLLSATILQSFLLLFLPYQNPISLN